MISENANKNSIWLNVILLLLIFDAITTIIVGNFIGFFIVAGVFNAVQTKNKWWIEWIVLLYIPLMFIVGFFQINDIDYAGEGIMIQSILYEVLFYKAWSEFNNKT